MLGGITRRGARVPPEDLAEELLAIFESDGRGGPS